MIINYKFNKSSEARDCVVKSVELEVTQELKINFNEIEYKDFIDKNYNCFLYDEAEYNEDIIDRYLENGTEDFILTEIYYVKDDCKLITVFNCSRNSKADSMKFKNSTLITTTKEIKQFTAPQQLKDYINTIQEPIKFITESSIDDVLMKEWIGEWEYKPVLTKQTETTIIFKESELLEFRKEFTNQLKLDKPEYIFSKDELISIEDIKNTYCKELTSSKEIDLFLDYSLDYGGYETWFVGYKFKLQNEHYFVGCEYDRNSNADYENQNDDIEIYRLTFNEFKTGSPKLNPNWTFKIT